jgi:hypothetical protein
MEARGVACPTVPVNSHIERQLSGDSFASTNFRFGSDAGLRAARLNGRFPASS